MDGGERARAEEARREDPAVAVDDDEVREPPPLRLRGDVRGELPPLLDRDERAVRKRAGVREREPAVPRPDLQLEPARGSAEPRLPVGREIERDRGVVLGR